MKKVYVARDPADAHLVKGLLEAERIPALVRGEFLWGARGEVPLTPETCPSVWVVDDADAGRAREIVAVYGGGKADPAPESPDWKCARCGEANEGPFLECWGCGASRSPGTGGGPDLPGSR